MHLLRKESLTEPESQCRTLKLHWVVIFERFCSPHGPPTLKSRSLEVPWGDSSGQWCSQQKCMDYFPAFQQVTSMTEDSWLCLKLTLTWEGRLQKVRNSGDTVAPEYSFRQHLRQGNKHECSSPAWYCVPLCSSRPQKDTEGVGKKERQRSGFPPSQWHSTKGSPLECGFVVIKDWVFDVSVLRLFLQPTQDSKQLSLKPSAL